MGGGYIMGDQKLLHICLYEGILCILITIFHFYVYSYFWGGEGGGNENNKSQYHNLNRQS